MWLCLATIIFQLLFFRRYFLRDVLKIRPGVLVTPSFVTEISSCISRRLFFSLDQMIFVTGLFFPFPATFSPDDLHPSKFHPYRCSPSIETPSASPPDAVSLSAHRPFSSGGGVFPPSGGHFPAGGAGSSYAGSGF
jgi:hypothetical protein